MGNLDIDTYTKENYVNMKADIGQGRLNIASKPPEARREVWNRFFLTAPRQTQSCQHLDFGLLAFITLRQ